MFENFPHDWQGFFSGVGTTVTLLLAAIGLFKFQKSKRERVIFQWRRLNNILASLPPGYDVRVEFGNNRGTTLVTDTITVSNRTKITITDDDFVQTPRISLKANPCIFDTVVFDSQNGARAEIVVEPNTILLRNITIPRDRALTFFVTHDNSLESNLNSTTKSLPDLKEVRFVDPKRRVSVPLLFWLFAALPIFLIYYALKLCVEANRHNSILARDGRGCLGGVIFNFSHYCFIRSLSIVRPKDRAAIPFIDI